MADLLRAAWAIAAKDILLEFRSRTAFVSALVFTALNGWLLHVRTSAEERGLGNVPSEVRIPPTEA